MKLVKNSHWNQNVRFPWLVVNSDGTLLKGFDTRKEAQEYISEQVAKAFDNWNLTQ